MTPLAALPATNIEGAENGCRPPMTPIILQNGDNAYVKYGDQYLEAVEWSMIYNSTGAASYTMYEQAYDDTTAAITTTAITTNGGDALGYYMGRAMGTGTGTIRAKVRFKSDFTSNNSIYAKVLNTSAATGDSCWVRLENGWDHFGEPCSSAVTEWAWVNDSTDDHICTIDYQWGRLEGGEIYTKKMTPEELVAYNEKRLKERMQKIIHSRHAPAIIVRNSEKRQPLPMPADIREQRARETLRRVIGERKFGNFIKNGFVTVKARSGRVYQIFPGHGFTKVYEQGNLVEQLCVVLQGDFPPTDSLIMRYIMILNNEQQFRSHANVHSVSQPMIGTLPRSEALTKSLAEIYKELKQQAQKVA